MLGPPGVGLAHVDVTDRGAGLGRADAGVGDLLRRDGESGVLRARGECAGDGAGENGRFHDSSPDCVPRVTRVELIETPLMQ